MTMPRQRKLKSAFLTAVLLVIAALVPMLLLLAGDDQNRAAEPVPPERSPSGEPNRVLVGQEANAAPTRVPTHMPDHASQELHLRVADSSGSGIVGAAIQVEGQQHAAVSGEDGLADVQIIPDATQTIVLVTVRAAQYISAGMHVAIGSNDRIEIRLLADVPLQVRSVTGEQIAEWQAEAGVPLKSVASRNAGHLLELSATVRAQGYLGLALQRLPPDLSSSLHQQVRSGQSPSVYLVPTAHLLTATLVIDAPGAQEAFAQVSFGDVAKRAVLLPPTLTTDVPTPWREFYANAETSAAISAIPGHAILGWRGGREEQFRLSDDLTTTLIIGDGMPRIRVWTPDYETMTAEVQGSPDGAPLVLHPRREPWILKHLLIADRFDRGLPSELTAYATEPFRRSFSGIALGDNVVSYPLGETLYNISVGSDLLGRVTSRFGPTDIALPLHIELAGLLVRVRPVSAATGELIRGEVWIDGVLGSYDLPNRSYVLNGVAPGHHEVVLVVSATGSAPSRWRGAFDNSDATPAAETKISEVRLTPER